MSAMYERCTAMFGDAQDAQNDDPTMTLHVRAMFGRCSGDVSSRSSKYSIKVEDRDARVRRGRLEKFPNIGWISSSTECVVLCIGDIMMRGRMCKVYRADHCDAFGGLEELGVSPTSTSSSR